MAPGADAYRLLNASVCAVTILIPREAVPEINEPLGRFIEFVFYSDDGSTCIGRIDRQSEAISARPIFTDEWLPAQIGVKHEENQETR